MASILVTGGAGYIATHTVVELVAAGYQPVLLDNLANSRLEAVRRVEALVGRALPFYHADIRDEDTVLDVLRRHEVEAVIHFAGLKAVGESVAQPLRYYENNVAGSVSLCNAMTEAGVKRMVFSSSATVYGDPASVPIREDAPVGAVTNPYGRTKVMIEQILRDLHAADAGWTVDLLRYFNPVGAHPSGRIGEDPNGMPNNLMPFVSQVAVGRRPHLSVYGNDYPTPDGTGVRDYIHVVDLAKGHVAALRRQEKSGGLVTVNLGTGRGYSVLEVVRAFEKASGKKVPYQVAPRRPGDIATCYADPSYAAEVYGWRASLDMDAMCADAWKWQSLNPNGYEG